MKLSYALLLVWMCCLAEWSDAQLPQTSIYLFDVVRTGKTWTLQHPKQIGSTKGYNNQPWFTPDGNGLYYVRSLDTPNTEIFYYHLNKKKSKRITRTKVPEYSPKWMPDMNRLSCVRVEEDKVTQHFYSYSLNGKAPGLLHPGLTSIGYYEWISMNEWVSFELPEPFYLVRHLNSQRRADTLANRVGRTFWYLRSKGVLSFVDKSDSNHWKIRVIDKSGFKNPTPAEPDNYTLLTETLPDEEDYCFMQDGSLLMAHQGILYKKRNPFKFKDSAWETLVDLKQFGITKCYRIALSPDNTRLALVVYTGEKP
ncbi:MAG: hypothetical protein JNM44_06285 [Chitinophagaceae bacterium]|nr:hypothetical protein [Chitinophagaceae bacterium]